MIKILNTIRVIIRPAKNFIFLQSSGRLQKLPSPALLHGHVTRLFYVQYSIAHPTASGIDPIVPRLRSGIVNS